MSPFKGPPLPTPCVAEWMAYTDWLGENLASGDDKGSREHALCWNVAHTLLAFEERGEDGRRLVSWAQDRRWLPSLKPKPEAA